MITIITCKNCGTEKGVHIDMTINKFETPCKKCGNSDNIGKSYSFCSLKCVKSFVSKLIRHKCSTHYYATWKSIDEKRKITHIGVTCNICNKNDKVKIPTKLKIKGMQYFNL